MKGGRQSLSLAGPSGLEGGGRFVGALVFLYFLHGTHHFFMHGGERGHIRRKPGIAAEPHSSVQGSSAIPNTAHKQEWRCFWKRQIPHTNPTD